MNAEILKKLREPFPPEQIGKLPKPTRAQTGLVRQNYKEGIRCSVCGGWHHPKVVHLDYVGHAALTNRLLDADPEWTWEPMALTPEGLPALTGGLLWIKLIIGGKAMMGVGDAQGKEGGDGMKEIIGDALRNAAMRFGVALDLWHKSDHPLHVESAPPYTDSQKEYFDNLLENEQALGMYLFCNYIKEPAYIALFNSGEPGLKMKVKESVRELTKKGNDIYLAIESALRSDTPADVVELIEDEAEIIMKMLNKALTPEDETTLNELR